MKDLNLIPRYYIDRQKQIHIRHLLSLLGIGLAAVLIFLTAIPIYINYNLTNEKDAIYKKIQGTIEYVEKQKEFNIVKSMYEQRKKASASLISVRNVEVSTIIDKIRNSAPQNFYVLTINMKAQDSTGTTVVLDAFGASDSDVASFISNLRKQNFFNTITITAFSKGNGKATRVGLSLHYKH